MRDIILLITTIFVIIIFSVLIMNCKIAQKPFHLDDGSEATLVVIDNGYAGDIILY